MSNDPYLPVDAVAERLGLPLGLLVRRVQAGDVPARRVDTPDGPRYEMRLGDLGIEAPPVDEVLAGDRLPAVELTGSVQPPAPQSVPSAAMSGVSFVAEPVSAPGPASSQIRSVESDLQSAWQAPTAAAPVRGDDIDSAVPPPRTGDAAEMTLIDYPRSGPLAEIASMSIDPRELVAGLLDRWERTLEQRIYAEQRQRFEAELTARQNLVKELQLELKSARAEHAAVQADKERQLSDTDRRLTEAERELTVARTQVQALQIQATEKRKRGWFFRR